MNPARTDLWEHVRAFAGFDGACLGGETGYSLTRLDALEQFDGGPEYRDQLRSRGLNLTGDVGLFEIYVARGTAYAGLDVRLHAFKGGVLVLGRMPKLHGAISLEGDDHVAIIGDSAENFRINLTMRSHAGAFLMGAGCSANDVDFLIEGPRRHIQVGDDALISYSVTVRTSDSHAVIDLDERRQINPPSSIVIRPHVWLGARSTVTKGLTVGRGAIVAEGSIVTKPVPPCVVVSGAPAEIKRIGVTWTRASQPTDVEIDQAIEGVRRPIS